MAANDQYDSSDLLSLSLGLDMPPAVTADLEGQLLQELPDKAKPTFLRSLGGLTANESHDFCEYVRDLKTEKQFRVIQAMSDSTLEGKRKFLSTLAGKMQAKKEKVRELRAQEERDLQQHRKLVEQAKGAADPKKSYSCGAALGTVSEDKEDGGVDLSVGLSTVQETIGLPGVSRSLSSSSVEVTKEDMLQVDKLLRATHITESELHLRELEINNKRFAAGKEQEAGAATIEMLDASKRDRPESLLNLTEQSKQKPPRRVKASDGYEPTPTQEDEEEEEAELSPDSKDEEAPSTKRWTKLQDNALRESVRIHGEKNWKAIAEMVPGRNHAQCLQRWRKVLKPGLVKGHWSFEEDQMLEFLVTQGCNNWGQIAERIPGRTPKQCRERWKNHLDPAINKGPYTEEEDKIILEAQEKLGNKWSQIAQQLKGRTEDSVKIRWKSLKQNPTKAKAAHEQQKQQPPQRQPVYQQNSALARQRQLALIHQQQQLQHSEAAQLEHQQQLQQQQLQMRLHERIMQQQQQHQLHQRAAHPGLVDSHGIPFKPEPNSIDVGLGSLPPPPGHNEIPSQLYPPSHHHAGGADNGYDYTSSNFSYMAAMASTAAPDHGDGRDQWDLHDNGAVAYPPAAYWGDHYAKPHGGLMPEPIPLTSSLLPDPSYNSGAAPEDEVYNEPVLEKFATEFPIGGM